MVAVLVWLAYDVRSPGLAPSSLFLDDAWVALVHRVPWSDFATVDFTTTGFSAVIKAWTGLVGYSDHRAQLPIFAAGVVLPGLLYLLLRRRVRGAIAIATSLLLVYSPTHTLYSVRIKQYVVEALLATLLLFLCWWVRQRATEIRRWNLLFIVCGIAFVTSFMLAVVVGVYVVVMGWVARRVGDAVWRAFMWRAAPLAAGILGWYLLVVRESHTDQLSDFWAGNYVATDDGVRGYLDSAASLTSDLLAGLTPLPLAPLVVLLVLSALGLLWRDRVLLALTVGPLFALVALSTLEMAPLGGGRTDIFLYPSLMTLLAAGLNELVNGCESVASRWRRGDRRAVAIIGPVLAGGLLVATVVGVSNGRSRDAFYPLEDLRPLMDEFRDRRRDGDAVLVYYGAMFHFALYSDEEFSVFAGPSPYGVRFAGDDIVLMQPHRDDPDRYADYVNRADEIGDRLWFVVAHPYGPEMEPIARQLEATGRSEVLSSLAWGAGIALFE